MSSITPIVFSIRNIPPAHDAKLKFEIWVSYARAISLDGQTPSWFPTINTGINSSMYGIILDGTDKIVILAMHVFNLRPSLAFSVYLFLNLLLMNYCISYIFNSLNLDNVWCITFVTINSLSYWAFWQYNWNLFLMLKLLVSMCFIHNLIIKRNLKSFLFLILIDISYIPYGGAVYLALIVVYLQGIAILVYTFLRFVRSIYKRPESKRVDFGSWRQKLRYLGNLKDQTFNLPSLTALLLIAFYIFYSNLQIQQIKSDIKFISPGRNSMGQMSLGNYLDYGGYTGFSKYLVLLGNILEGQVVGKGFPDFQLIVGPVCLIYILIGVIYGKLRINRFVISLALSILVFVFVFKPSSTLWALAFLYAPGLDLARHLAYLSVITLIPIALVVAKLYSSEQLVIKNRKFVVIVTLSSVIYMNFIGVLIWKPIITKNKIDFASPAFTVGLCLVISYALYFYAINRYNRKQFNSMYLAFVYMFAAVGQSAVSYAVQVPSTIQMRDSYLNRLEIPYAVSLPKSRTPSPIDELNEDWSESGGVTYATKGFISNGDYCKTNWRQDFVSTSIWEKTVDSQRKNDNCIYSKLSLETENKEFYANVKFKKLSFNKVEVIYKISESTHQRKFNSATYILVYRDAMSRAGLWEAHDNNGNRVPIVETKDGFKSVALHSLEGKITFKIKLIYVFNNSVKFILDILVYFFILAAITVNFKFRTSPLSRPFLRKLVQNTSV